MVEQNENVNDGVPKLVMPTEPAKREQTIQNMLYAICKVMFNNTMVAENYTWSGLTKLKGVSKRPFKKLKNILSWMTATMQTIDPSIAPHVVDSFFSTKYCKQSKQRAEGRNLRKSAARTKFKRNKKIITSPMALNDFEHSSSDGSALHPKPDQLSLAAAKPFKKHEKVVSGHQRRNTKSAIEQGEQWASRLRPKKTAGR